MEQYIKIGVTFLLVLVIFWFAESHRRSQEKKLKKMQSELKVGDKIITYSGLSGTIKEVLEDRIIVSLNPGKVDISIEKWAVAGLDDRTIENKE